MDPPLHNASRFGHFEIAQLLVDRGAYVNATQQALWSALHLASANEMIIHNIHGCSLLEKELNDLFVSIWHFERESWKFVGLLSRVGARRTRSSMFGSTVI